MLINNSIPETHKANQIMWLALTIGAIMIAGIFVQMRFSEPNYFDIGNFVSSIYAGVGVVLTLLSVFVTDTLVRNRIDNVNLQGLSIKFDDFRSNFVFKAALHEGAALICAILMHLEGNFYFIFFVLINVLMLYTARPTIEKFKSWYRLTSEENRELDAMEFLPLMG